MPYRYLNRNNSSPYFHVFNRGNDKKSIFFCTADYLRFCNKLEEYSMTSGVKVIAYCLMRNHYHLLLEEKDFGSIARLMQRLNVSYAMYFNAKYKHIGHLFQGPYGEKVIDSDEYLLQVSAYVHNNPAALGVSVEDYRWSSYSIYLGGQDSWLSKNAVLSLFKETNKVEAYRNFVISSQDLVLHRHARPGLDRPRFVNEKMVS